jgi:16S rRNA (adenine1518-N6/adenine1519-N6)-dimethyltransferase
MSSVIKMEIRAESLLDEHDEKTFFKVVRAAFGQRRKTLVNALHSVYGNAHSKEAISEYVASCGLDIKVRGEVLNIEDFIKLARYFIE